jgi:hypothetical protein
MAFLSATKSSNDCNGSAPFCMEVAPNICAATKYLGRTPQ